MRLSQNEVTPKGHCPKFCVNGKIEFNCKFFLVFGFCFQK